MARGHVKIVPVEQFRQEFPTVAPERLGLHAPQTLPLWGLGDVESQEVYVIFSDESRDFPWVNPDCQYGPAPRYSDRLTKVEVKAAEWLDHYPALGV